MECADGALTCVDTLEKLQEVIDKRNIRSKKIGKCLQVYTIKVAPKPGEHPSYYTVCNSLRYRSCTRVGALVLLMQFQLEYSVEYASECKYLYTSIQRALMNIKTKYKNISPIAGAGVLIIALQAASVRLN